MITKETRGKGGQKKKRCDKKNINDGLWMSVKDNTNTGLYGVK